VNELIVINILAWWRDPDNW